MRSKEKIIPYELSDYVLEKYFVQTRESQGWLDNKKIGVAVSGGGDSIALLWLFSRFYHGIICALHINHGIRGIESDKDMNFTNNFAQYLKIPFAAKTFNVPVERLKGESLESAARRVRYRELCDFARGFKLDYVFLGHNRDDLAETVLFNIIRGTGIRGSVGITESSELEGVKFYRPLLGLRRKFLRDILRVRGLPWREDSSNDDDSYTRNYLRLKLLPLIESKINSSAIEHLANFGEDMRRVRELEDNKSIELMNSCRIVTTPLNPPLAGETCENTDSPRLIRRGAGGEVKTEGWEGLDSNFIFDRKKLKAFDTDSISLVIREAGRQLGLKTLSRSRCLELAGLIAGSRNFIFQWSRGANIKCRQGKIFFEVKSNDSTSPE